MITNRNFSTISPSAKALLLLKGHTNIPYARRTAEIISLPEKYIPDFGKKDKTFWARTLHFENRYWSIDFLLKDIENKNILELASGFSFRGFELTKHKDCCFIDTELPEMVEKKKEILKLLSDKTSKEVGHYELRNLNALDDEQFLQITDQFTKGEIVIVNEGLLMYLDDEEKEKLCKTIYQVLKKHGGYWITADVYIKNKLEKMNLNIDNRTNEFFKQHNIENNKFGSFEEAENFFKRMGFEIDKVAKIEKSKLSSLRYFKKNISFLEMFKFARSPKMQATWRLKIVQ